MHSKRLGLFQERKKFTLLSILSALVVISTAFVGVSIYAQTDEGELTTFEEEAIAGGADMGDTGLEEDADTTTSIATDNATSFDNATSGVPDVTSNVTEDGSTSIAEVMSLLEGLQACNVGTAVISNETQVAAVPDAGVAPTISVEVMTETEVAELASNETGTASTDETSIASAQCLLLGGGNETSTSGSGSANITSTENSNATLTTSNMTGTDNAMPTQSSNETSISSVPESNDEILVIAGQDFVPGQVVLIWSENELVGVDDVDSDGSIEAKIPVPDAGSTAVAANDTGSTSTELRFVESGTLRTTTFEFDGETLTAAAGGDIEAEGSDGVEQVTPPPAPTPSGNATSTSDTLTSSDTSTPSDTDTSSSDYTPPQ